MTQIYIYIFHFFTVMTALESLWISCSLKDYSHNTECNSIFSAHSETLKALVMSNKYHICSVS